MSPYRTEAYRTAGFALVVSAGVILAALGFEHIGGYIPCPLCLQQRWAYYAAIPLLFAAMVLVGGSMPRTAAMVLLVVALAFLANAGLGVYQSGAEWKYWPGPETCGTAQKITGNAGRLLKDLDSTRVIRCDEASWRMFGLSFAGWNVVVSLILFIAALKAAFSASASR